MDTTTLAVIGTGLTGIGTAVALFAALWRVQGNRFDALERHIDARFTGVDKQFAGVDKQFAGVDKRFEGVDRQFAALEKQWTERFEMAERSSRERFEAAERASRERFEMAEKASRERFEMAEKASLERFGAVDARFETVERQGQATHAAVCALNGRFDDLYRHLLGPREQAGQPGATAG